MLLEQVASIRERLANHQPSIGTWMQLADANVAEILSQNGYDWIAIDMEHGVSDFGDLPNIIRAIEMYGCVPIVRVGDDSELNLKRCLDAGAAGIIVPKVESAEQMEQIYQRCCWPPAGQRGVGFSRANRFGLNFDQYLESSQAPLIIAMIETADGVANLDAILATDRADAIFIGPYDLSASLGVTGEFSDRAYKEAIDQISAIALRYDIRTGVHVVDADPSALKDVLDGGHCFVAYSMDTVFLRNASNIRVESPFTLD